MTLGYGPLAGQPLGALPDVSGKQVVHEGAAVVGGGDSPNGFAVRSGELPDGDPRGIDGWPDFDGVKDFDQGPEQPGETPPVDPEVAAIATPEWLAALEALANPKQPKTHKASITETVRVDMRADATVVPSLQKRAHDAMARDIDDLKAELRKLAATGQTGQIGHNKPPTAIDGAPEITAAQIVEIVRAVDFLRQSPPAPPAAPEKATEAQQSLLRIYLEAAARRGGELTPETLAALAKTGGRWLAFYLLFKVIESSGVWIEVIKLAAKAAGH